MGPQRVLWYFADPMCSWCWGFSPVISAIRERYKDDFVFVLLMGGLRPSATDPVTPEFREDILGHWSDVRKLTGQPFKMEGAMPEGFVYDTEPPCRAVVAVHDLNPDVTFDYLKSVQQAFYAEQRDVTRADILAGLVQQQKLDPAMFMEKFLSEEVRQKTQAHFRQTAEIGIRGFPSVVLQNQAGATLLTRGWRSFEDLRPEIDDWLKNGPPAT
jgi:putative protein-disulfide isomerase